MIDNVLIVIPAIKKSAVIPDQLVKKLNGITLIQRAINTAKEITNNILIVTDSEEISLIAKRSKVSYFKDALLKFSSENILLEVQKLVKDKEFGDIILYRANTPLIGSSILKKAFDEYKKDKNYIVTSVKELDKNLLEFKDGRLKYTSEHDYFKELKAFYIFHRDLKYYLYKSFVIDYEKSIEIETYQDWWVCEKILQRKRIVFNVIGSIEVGMGHIYHSLALAHEITDHEVVFVCDEKYKIAVENIASKDYKVITTNNVAETIINLKPHIVINDVLNTQESFILNLKKHNIKVVNFEDLGEGAKKADLVINELYEVPQIEGDNFLWGHQYITLRDEFDDACVQSFQNSVNGVLITFGGTDQNNLTLISLQSIIETVQKYNIKVYIVCGLAYPYKQELEDFIQNLSYEHIELFYGVETISTIMEKVQLAISSNGRTIYELAHMHIPAIAISHHKREATHSFATLERGFINLGVFNETIGSKIEEKFRKLVEDKDYRELLYFNIKKYNFKENKQKVVKKILSLISKGD